MRLLTDDEVRSRAPEIWAVYDAVVDNRMSYEQWRDGMLLRHAARDRFRFAAALDGLDIVGFAWGYRGAPGQYYTDSVRDALGDELADQWQPAFEIVSLAVLPAHRRAGTGRALLRMMTDGIAGPALLSTWEDESDPAVRLYRSEGWQTLGTHLRADGSRTMQIMGLPG